MLKTMVGGFGNPGAFITLWKTDNTGTSTSSQITWPTSSSGSYSCTVYWGDGTSNAITTYNDAAWTHTYPSPGTYKVIIVGTFRGIFFNAGGDRLKLLNISQWGGFGFGNTAAYFSGCANLTINATGAPSMATTTTFTSAFSGCSSIRLIPGMDSWNMSAITSLSGAFQNCVRFNQSIGSWVTSSLLNMANAFNTCSVFNQNIGSWNVSNVTSLAATFANCAVFNGNVGSWNISSALTNLASTFASCPAFNQNISSWNVSGVSNMIGTFSSCTSFNQNIGSWNTSSVTSCSSMFLGCTAFNQNISSWNTALVTTMASMFNGCTSFNQNLGAWIVTQPTTMSSMFAGCTLSNANYNGILAGWGAQVVKTGVVFSGGNSHYDSTSGGFNGTAGRAVLTGTYSWSISDGGTP